MIDWTKPIQTVDGKPARFLTVLKCQPDDDLSHVVAVVNESGAESICYATVRGTNGLSCDLPKFVNMDPGKEWTPISLVPDNCRTVLICTSEFRRSGNVEDCWTGFWNGRKWRNNQGVDNVRGPAFWRNIEK